MTTRCRGLRVSCSKFRTPTEHCASVPPPPPMPATLKRHGRWAGSFRPSILPSGFRGSAIIWVRIKSPNLLPSMRKGFAWRDCRNDRAAPPRRHRVSRRRGLLAASLHEPDYGAGGEKISGRKLRSRPFPLASRGGRTDGDGFVDQPPDRSRIRNTQNYAPDFPVISETSKKRLKSRSQQV